MDGMVYWLRDRVTRCTSDAPEMITNRPTRWIMLQFLCLQMCVTVQRDDMHHGSIGWYNVEMIVCSDLLSGWKRWKVKKPRFWVHGSQTPALNLCALVCFAGGTRSMSTPRRTHVCASWTWTRVASPHVVGEVGDDMDRWKNRFKKAVLLSKQLKSSS